MVSFVVSRKQEKAITGSPFIFKMHHGTSITKVDLKQGTYLFRKKSVKVTS